MRRMESFVAVNDYEINPRKLNMTMQGNVFWYNYNQILRKKF